MSIFDTAYRVFLKQILYILKLEVLPDANLAEIIIMLCKQPIRNGYWSFNDRISRRIVDNHSMRQLSRVTLYSTTNRG